MTVRIDVHAPVHVLRFDGDLGAAAEHDLRKAFVELAKGGHLHAVADLRPVAFMDSTALGTLVWGLKNLRERGGDLRLFGLQGFVARLFELTTLDKAFRIFATEDEALHSYDEADGA